MSSKAVVSYEWHGAAILRATTRPSPADVPRMLDLDDPFVTRGWLVRVWQHDDVREALRVASPSLCNAVDGVARGAQSQPRQIRRTALSVVSYLLRWQHRPTPFGRFAGTAAVSVGARPRTTWGSEHQVRVRADAEWITDIIQRLHESSALLERLPLVANNAAQERGDRLVAPGPPADGRAQLMAPVEISVRLTRSVRAALGAAAKPIVYGDLRDHLHGEFPAATGEQIETLLTGLVAQNLLITSLRAPMTTLDALGHMCAELKSADGHTVEDVGGLVRELYAIHDDLTGHEPARSTSSLAATTERMLALSPVAPAPLLIDTALDCEAQVPEQVVAEAQEAVAALYRSTPYPYGYQQWRDYHRRFRARYGVGALVPVLDLVADSGLGLPAEYVGSERGRTLASTSARDDVVIGLVMQALMEGHDEIVLTDAIVADLAKAAGSEEPLFVPRAEVGFEIHAHSSEALMRGAFQLLLTGVPRPGSSMAGRFAHLLPTEQREALSRSYRTDGPGTVTAQLSFSPRRRRNENVVRTTRLLPHVIDLSEHRGNDEGVIPLADIGVTADARRLRLMQLSTGRPIEVRVLHALEAGVQTPPLARFLAEINTARCAVYKPFDFGGAARLPYLPRVRYRRTILTSARWLLTAQDLPGRSTSSTDWEEAFTAWRGRLRVPARVAMVEIDQRLPLDLTHPVHLRLLRSRLDELRRLELREVADSDEHGWIGRPHEILLPLTRSHPKEEDTVPTPRLLSTVSADDAHLPGAGSVLRAHLHAHPERFSEILDRHLPRLLASFGDAAPPWWFTRHREMARPEAGQHLALFLHLDTRSYGDTAEHVHAWAGELRRNRLASGLTLETYEPQAGRYGHGAVMEAAHNVFVADSAAALAQIRLTARTDALAPQALTVASILDLVTTLAASADQGMSWLLKTVPQGHGRLQRSLRDQVLELAAVDPPLLGDGVAQAWQARAAAVRTYREALAGQRDPLTVVRSLLHQHHIRALGVDPVTEAATLRLARAAALRHTARAGA